MKIKIEEILLEDKEIIKNLLFDYQKELLDTDNPDEYKYLDSYWNEQDRYPFYIKKDEEIVGFVFVNTHTLITKDSHSIAEFFIMPKYRKLGIGEVAAKIVFEKFAGNWEVRVLEENLNAQLFWQKVIDKHTNGKFSKSKHEDWDGVIYYFS